MSKSTRSISLPERAGNVTDRSREVRTVLKNNDNKRTIEKENEVEEHYGRSSLSFRVDQMTLVQRKDIMERQKKIADMNMSREIDCFHTMLKLTDQWQESEIRENLSRMSILTDGLKMKIGMLSQNATNLGSLRQEYSSSSRVAVISEYVEMIKEKTIAVHNKVVETKKTLLDNKIEVDRHYPDCKPNQSQSRSVSINSMCPSSSSSSTSFSNTRSTNYHERSKSVTDSRTDSSYGMIITERRKSKKCSIFDTINENVNYRENNDNISNEIDITRLRKKSSKKVSIAENLNCDYSDISSLYNEDDIGDNEALKDVTNTSFNASEERTLYSKSVLMELISNLTLFMLISFINLFNLLSSKPYYSIVIFLLVYIFYAKYT